jgi:integrase
MAIYQVRKAKQIIGYRIRWYDSDGRERKKTVKGISREEALRLERDILAKRDRGETLRDLRHAPTFAAFAQLWVDERTPHWKASTLEQYESILNIHLTPTFGPQRISTITEGAACRWFTGLTAQGLSARRMNLVLLVFKMVTKLAHRRRWLAEDPLREVKMLREPKTDVQPFAPDEIDQFMAHCPPWWKPYFVTAFWTGARPNELAALKWGDLDWNGRTLRIRAGRYRGVEGPPKTKHSERTLDLLPPVIEALKAQKAQQAAYRMRHGEGAPDPGKDYVFTGTAGGLLNVNYMREVVWPGTLTAAKLLYRTFYQTRHSFASNALAAGEAPSWVSQQLGHSSPEMLFKVYARWIPNRTRRDGSALLQRMTHTSPAQPSRTAAGPG